MNLIRHGVVLPNLLKFLSQYLPTRSTKAYEIQTAEIWYKKVSPAAGSSKEPVPGATITPLFPVPKLDVGSSKEPMSFGRLVPVPKDPVPVPKGTEPEPIDPAWCPNVSGGSGFGIFCEPAPPSRCCHQDPLEPPVVPEPMPANKCRGNHRLSGLHLWPTYFNSHTICV